MSASAAPLPTPLASGAVHPVDEVLASPLLVALGIQHVLVMYAGAVAVPLIIGAAVKAPREQVAFLITRDLLGCGIALLQSVMSGDSAFACRSSWV
jgi:uric acid transporter